jgi:hypothetical protein
MQISVIMYRLAVACWLGGVALFTTTLTPTIFKSYSRDVAGGIVGILFPGYFRWGLACGVIAFIGLALSRGRHAVASAIILAVMLTLTSIQAFPPSRRPRRTIPSAPSSGSCMPYPPSVIWPSWEAASPLSSSFDLVVLEKTIYQTSWSKHLS